MKVGAALGLRARSRNDTWIKRVDLLKVNAKRDSGSVLMHARNDWASHPTSLQRRIGLKRYPAREFGMEKPIKGR